MRTIVLLVLVTALGSAEPVWENLIVRDTVPGWNGPMSHPIVARDMAPGAGIFEYCSGAPVLEGYTWPLVAAGPNRTYHLVCLDSTATRLFYSRCTTWCNWSEPVRMCPPGPDPGFPTHNIAASKASGKVCVTWVLADGDPDPGFYRLSTDGGASWQSPQQLPWPEAFGGDTATSFHVSSLFPFYDVFDSLHIVACVHPRLNDTDYVVPAEIWHWCPDNTPNWSRVHRAGCLPEHMLAPVGYNALYACRPSLGTTTRGRLFALWEQFDSSNAEPGPPARLRAGIHMALSENGGRTWRDADRMTPNGTASFRFPCVADGELGLDLHVLYITDKTAGFFVLGEGRATKNPVLAQPIVLVITPRPGRPDTIGGTTYDLQCVGPALRTVGRRPCGVHAAWNYSDDVSGRFPDLNMRYNYYDYPGEYWNWIDPDYMASGINVFTRTTMGGSLDADPVTGVAVVSGSIPPPSGVKGTASVPFPARTSTIVRGVLLLPASPSTPHTSLLDLTGCKVADLHPGLNDVRHLPPGVYFVRLRGDGPELVRKVIVTR